MEWLLNLALVLSLAPNAGDEVDLAPVGFSHAKILSDDAPVYATPRYDDSQWPQGAWHEVEERDVWWLRRSLVVPEPYRTAGVPVGLYISASASSEVWWDGRFIGRNGRVGHSRSDELPGAIDAVFSIPGELLTAGNHLLAVRFSSHHAGAGIATPVDSLYLAPYGSPRRWSQARYRPSLVMGGALGLAAAFLSVLCYRERRRSVPWLLLACLAAIGQMTFEVSRAYWSYPYAWHEDRLLGIAMFTALGGLGILGYLLRRFRQPAPLLWIAVVAAAFLMLLVSGKPTGPVTWMMILIWLLAAMGACAAAIRRGERSAWTALVAVSLLLAAMMIDPDGFTDRTYFFGLVIILLLFFADTVATQARIRRERDRVRLRSVRLELELLKRHLRPHFLMNTLTALSEWLETEPHTGAAMIDALAREFRLLNDMTEQRLVALDDEIALCRAHLEVMSYRQGCTYRLVVNGATRLQVPPAILHTLLENALTHADYGPDAEIRFQLDVQRDQKITRLIFTSPAGRSPATPATTEGTGTGYVRARLEEAFGEPARIESQPANRGWRTCIEIPAVP